MTPRRTLVILPGGDEGSRVLVPYPYSVCGFRCYFPEESFRVPSSLSPLGAPTKTLVRTVPGSTPRVWSAISSPTLSSPPTFSRPRRCPRRRTGGSDTFDLCFSPPFPPNAPHPRHSPLTPRLPCGSSLGVVDLTPLHSRFVTWGCTFSAPDFFLMPPDHFSTD